MLSTRHFIYIFSRSEIHAISPEFFGSKITNKIYIILIGCLLSDLVWLCWIARSIFFLLIKLFRENMKDPFIRSWILLLFFCSSSDKMKLLSRNFKKEFGTFKNVKKWFIKSIKRMAAIISWKKKKKYCDYSREDQIHY